MQCAVHQLDRPDDVCSSCGGLFCTLCMLYPNGSRKPGTCRRCALARAGVRHAKVIPVSRREFRRRRVALQNALQTRPETLEVLVADLSWLDKVPFASEAGGRVGGRPQGI